MRNLKNGKEVKRKVLGCGKIKEYKIMEGYIIFFLFIENKEIF